MKLILFLSFVFLGTINWAQSIHFNYVDGTNASYNIEDVRKITFDLDEMNLHLWDGSIYTWNISTIGYYEFDESSLNVQDWLHIANIWEVNIFPNPISSNFTLSFNLPQSDKVSISLYDIHGKLVLSKDLGYKDQGRFQEEITDLNHIPPGQYTCLISGQKNTITKELLKK